MAFGAFVLAFVAGILSILSPCVLPILPIVLGAAASEHRWGPAVLAAGVAVSFVAIGLFAATIGYSIGLDAGLFRNVAAALMITVGVVLLVPRLQERLALAGTPLAAWARTAERTGRPNGGRTTSWCGLEPLCRSDARSSINSRSSGSRSRGSGGHNVSIRVRRRSSACLCWVTLARDRIAMASAPYCRQSRCKGGFRACTGRSRRVGAQ